MHCQKFIECVYSTWTAATYQLFCAEAAQIIALQVKGRRAVCLQQKLGSVGTSVAATLSLLQAIQMQGKAEAA